MKAVVRQYKGHWNYEIKDVWVGRPKIDKELGSYVPFSLKIRNPRIDTGTDKVAGKWLTDKRELVGNGNGGWGLWDLFKGFVGTQ
jgi:hypothetical protein